MMPSPVGDAEQHDAGDAGPLLRGALRAEEMDQLQAAQEAEANLKDEEKGIPGREMLIDEQHAHGEQDQD